MANNTSNPNGSTDDIDLKDIPDFLRRDKKAEPKKDYGILGGNSQPPIKRSDKPAAKQPNKLQAEKPTKAPESPPKTNSSNSAGVEAQPTGRTQVEPTKKATAKPPTKAKAESKSKSKKTAKPKKAAQKKAAKPKAKKIAKPKTEPKPNKEAKPVEEPEPKPTHEPPKRRASRKKKDVEYDQFGFVKGTKTSLAASMYATSDGATTEDIKKKLGSPYLNLFKHIEGKGWKIIKSKVIRSDGRKVFRYQIKK